jgi:hypothetical protein
MSLKLGSESGVVKIGNGIENAISIDATGKASFDHAPVVPAASASGEVVNFDQVIGLGQTWQDVIANRAFGVTYTNTTGKPIMVAARFSDGNNGALAYLHIWAFVDGLPVCSNGAGSITSTAGFTVTFIVPNGSNYSVIKDSNVVGALSIWSELR